MSYLAKWTGRSVMVVDDSASHRFVATELMRELGFASVYEARHGLDAIAQLEHIEYIDLVLVDLIMPEMDGVKLIEYFAKNFMSKVRYVAVMSGVERDVLDTVQCVVDASSLELLAILQKPLTQTEMVRVMDNCDPEWNLEGSPKSKLIFTRDEVDAALSAGELIPYYQPKILVRQKKLSGFEALVRWAHPKYGILPPAMFVHHIEEGELGFRFFYAFLDLVCAAMTRILVHAPGVHCSINLPVPLLDDTNIVDEMTRIVHEHKLNSHSIVLEVTETSVMSNLSAALGTLARLRLNGFGLAMDDYGTGYSSIKQLSRIPFTELKIDREFVADAANSPKKLAILSSAIAMCQRLQILSVAEGVETEVDWQQLVTLGCDLSQGYYHSRPLSEDMLLKWIAENSVV